MALMILKSTDSGAPTLNGVNGALNDVLRWALVQNGWAVEYGPTGNASVFRPGSGNRHRLHVRHDSAVSGNASLALVRGCENASDATTLVDPFPTVAQVANGSANWLVSATAASTARAWTIYLWEDFFYIIIDANSSGEMEVYWFGDLEGTRPEDAYATVVSCKNNSNTGYSTAARYAHQLQSLSYPTAQAVTSTKVFFCRDISGMSKSSKGQMNGPGSYVGFPSSSAPPAMGGYLSKIEREKVAVHDLGSNLNASSIGTLSQYKRGWMPSLWQGLHSSNNTLTTYDTFTDTAYASGSLFEIIIPGTNIIWIFERGSTWSPPSG